MTDGGRVQEFIGAVCWAVVGASDDREKFGNITFRELKKRGKEVYPVNPRAAEVEGDPCYPNLSALPEGVERVLVVVPPAASENVVKEAKAAGLTHIWFQPGAESETALAYCADNGMEAISGHCILRTK